jgi:hypothetical protein
LNVFDEYEMSNIIGFSSSGEIDEPIINLEAVEPALNADDGEEQSAVMEGLNRYLPPSQRRQYEDVPERRVLLSRFYREYASGASRYAVRMLQDKIQVQIDPEFIVDPDEDRIYWNNSTHYLDFIAAVSNTPGLWAAVPKTATDHTYNFRLDLRQPTKMFSPKFVKTGYDMEGRLLYIGNCRNEDIYLAMCPKEIQDGEGADVPPGTCSGSPRMSTSHYRIIAAFIAFALSALANHNFIIYGTVERLYELDLEDSRPNFSQYSNVL